uniref:Uncharacterized protein n=1 Tax=Arundo donax TaxID=35708 RepID=A0A0A9C4X4_ARUDO
MQSRLPNEEPLGTSRIIRSKQSTLEAKLTTRNKLVRACQQYNI